MMLGLITRGPQLSSHMRAFSISHIGLNSVIPTSLFPVIDTSDPKSASFSPLGQRLAPVTNAIGYRSPYATHFPRDQLTPQAPLTRRPYERVVKLRRLMNPSALGKHVEYDAWCLVGDRNGSAGFAHARSSQAGRAVKKAMALARRSMRSYDLFENRTLYHDIELQYHCLKMRLYTKPPGYSVQAQRNAYDVCMALGIQDLAVDILEGTINPITVVRGMFCALDTFHKTPTQVSQARGMHIEEVEELAVANRRH